MKRVKKNAEEVKQMQTKLNKFRGRKAPFWWSHQKEPSGKFCSGSWGCFNWALESVEFGQA